MINLRWGTNPGVTVAFEPYTIDPARPDKAVLGKLTITLSKDWDGRYLARSWSDTPGLAVFAVAGCQQTALDRLHTRLTQARDEINGALNHQP